MPYLVLKKNGRKQQTPFVFTQVEVERLARDNACYVVQNTTTHRKSRVGAACRRAGKIPRTFPGLNGLGLWPFDKLFKKQAKRRVGDQTIIWTPGRGGGSPMSRRGEGVLRGSRRRRRRRR